MRFDRASASAIATCLLFACGQGSGGPGEQPNPCATKGATYQLMFSGEKSGGTCGAFPTFWIDIGADGTVQPNDNYLSCPSQQVTSCTTHASNCTGTKYSTTCTITLDLTFSTDGSTATGTDSVSCSMQGQTCASSYTVTGARQ